MYFVQPYGFEHPVGFSSSKGSSHGLYTVAEEENTRKLQPLFSMALRRLTVPLMLFS